MKLDENGMVTEIPDDLANGIMNDGRTEKEVQRAINFIHAYMHPTSDSEYEQRKRKYRDMAIKALEQQSSITPMPEDTITVPVDKIHILTEDEIKDIDPGDDVFVNVTEKLTQTISLVKEDQDKFIFEAMIPFLTQINHIVIPKRVLERALITFEEEHTAEWKALMKEYGGTGI